MAGNHQSWAVLAGLSLIAFTQTFLGCSPVSDDTAVDETLIGLVLADTAHLIIEPTLEQFLIDMTVLQEALEDWTEAADTNDDDKVTRILAEEAYLDAMYTWQMIELYQIGPLGSSLSAVAGESRRDEIYSWPTVNECRVDQETVEAAWDDTDFYDNELVNVRGLDALEYLLHAPDNQNDCPNQAEPNLSGGWTSLSAEGVEINRAHYASSLAGNLADITQAMLSQWSADGEHFSDTLANAGQEGSPYESPTQGLNAIFDALFYLDKHTKDQKIAQPLGLLPCDLNCDVESFFAETSHLWIRANLQGFRTLFTGADGYGIDDILASVGHEILAQSMIEKIDAAIAAAESLELSIDEAIETDPDAVLAIHTALKEVTDILKGDLATVLSLQIPTEAAGDND